MAASRFGLLLLACVSAVQGDGNAHVLHSNLADVPADGIDTNMAKNETMAVLKIMIDCMKRELREDGFQVGNAAIALTLGAIMCFDGEFVFKYILIAIAGLFTLLLTHTTLASNHPDFSEVVKMAVSVEVCAVTCMIAFVGFKGFRLAMGMVLGGLMAFYLHTLAKHQFGDKFADHWAFIVFGGNLCLVVGLYPFLELAKGHRRVMAVVMAFFGSLLIISAFGFFTLLFAQKFMKTVFGCEVPTAKPYWVDFVMAYCFAGTTTVGIFADAEWKINTMKILGMEWGLDRIIARTFWLIFFIAGIVVQSKLEKRYAAKGKAKAESLNSAKATAKKEPKAGGLFSKFKKKDDSKHTPLLA